MYRAIQDGAPVDGYFHWSFMDNFELARGKAIRFGLIHLNYDTLERTPKKSAYWYSELIRNNCLKIPDEE